MALLVHWKNSLNLLKPNNAYLLFLVSLKAAINGLRLLFPFIVGWLIGFFVSIVFLGYAPINALTEVMSGFGFLYMMSLCFAIHPSVKRKTINSFFSFDFIKLYIFILVGSALVFIPLSLFVLFLYSFCGRMERNAAIVADLVLGFIWNLLFISNLIFLVLDAEGGFWSRTVLALKRMAKVICYNAPVWIILLIFTWIIKLGTLLLQNFLLNTISEFASVLFGIGMYIVCVPVLIAIINTIYIKRVYDEKELYV